MNPRVFKKEGLKHLDRVVDLVREKHADRARRGG
jgi:hypothetical protein